MRRRVPGMDSLDEAILEFFHALGHPGGEIVGAGPTMVWLNLYEIRGVIDKQQNTVSRHMTKLADAGLLSKVDKKRGYYGISDLGIRYIENDISEEEREEIRDAL